MSNTQKPDSTQADSGVVFQTSVNEIINLRHRILRKGLPVESAHFEGDDGTYALHFAMYFENVKGPIACVSLMSNPLNGASAWQLRGMAVDETFQSRGVGTELLHKVEEYIHKRQRITLLWCNAREPAVKFYEKNGWVKISDVFDIPTAGPHIKMKKEL